MASSGIHPHFNLEQYAPEEVKIINKLRSEWYLTSSTFPIKLGLSSVYRAFLMRPTDLYSEMFNLEREIMVVFSSYARFEMRTIDAYETAATRWQALRIDNVCRFLISRDPDVLRKVDDILKNDPELPIIVPFTYDEILQYTDPFFIRNRMRRYFYTRDLFAFESPLRRDLYFFGRNQIVQELINRHRSGENSALFGLRRSGKTSIIFGIERATKVSGDLVVVIDCQSPSVHKRRWYDLLKYIVDEIRKKYNVSGARLRPADRYSDLNAADAFSADMKRFKADLGHSVFLIFDEIERISPRTGSSEHWKGGDDFVTFWQAVRSAFQRQEKAFSFLIVGTNARCVETAFINGQDNPIFNSVRFDYIPPFSLNDTREMVRKLGRYMGMQFDESIYGKINDDLGGHPYLIRHLCSLIHHEATGSRPVQIDRTVYEAARKRFMEQYVSYTDLVLEVLRTDYLDEFEMLIALANDDLDTFSTYAEDPNFTNHLIGYGLIARGARGFFFRNEIIRAHIRRLKRFSKRELTPAEVAAEVAERRRGLERRLRIGIRRALQFARGSAAAEVARESLRGRTQGEFDKLGFEKSFEVDSIILNLSDLFRIVENNWDIFKVVSQCKQEDFQYHARRIQEMRTDEAHSRNLSGYEDLRRSFDFLETVADRIC